MIPIIIVVTLFIIHFGIGFILIAVAGNDQEKRDQLMENHYIAAYVFLLKNKRMMLPIGVNFIALWTVAISFEKEVPMAILLGWTVLTSIFLFLWLYYIKNSQVMPSHFYLFRILKLRFFLVNRRWPSKGQTDGKIEDEMNQEEKQMAERTAGFEVGYETLLADVQKYGFLEDWNLDRFTREVQGDLSYDPWEEEVIGDRNDVVEGLIVATWIDGFFIDWKFSSADVVSVANHCLKKFDLAFSKGDPPVPDISFKDSPFHRRTLIYFGEGRDRREVGVEFQEPKDIFRKMNEVIVDHGVIFLIQRDRGDSQGFVLIRNEIKERLIADKRFSFREITAGASPGFDGKGVVR